MLHILTMLPTLTMLHTLTRRVPKPGGGLTSLPKATRTAFLEARLRVATAPQVRGCSTVRGTVRCVAR